jgi:hypothetical protein
VAKIIAKKFALVDSLTHIKVGDHLYYEFVDNTGGRIAQVNGLSYDRVNNVFIPMGTPFNGDDSIRIHISNSNHLGTADPYAGTTHVVFDDSTPDGEESVKRVLESIKQLGAFINAQDLDYTPVPSLAFGDAFNIVI